MNNDYTKPEFKKLLQKLQEESWQLELLISGFAIFGLFTAIPTISEGFNEAQNSQQIYKFVTLLIALISCSILIFNLLLHVLLRGLWIGALGLRYVSGDIDYDSLKYSAKFTKYLKKRVGSFDKYIGTLENYCSVIFAVSFLLIFYVLAITFTVLTIVLISTQLIDNDNLPNWLSLGVGVSAVVFISIGLLLTLLDFITLGFLKKKKWLSKIYFPVYWVFSFITLSFLYRPLVYNFLDNKFGKRLSLALVPFYILIALATSFNYKVSNYLHSDISSNSYVANNNNYENLLDETNGFIDNVAIQSKVISENYIKVFVLYSENIEDNIFDFNPKLRPEEDARGLTSGISFGTNINFRKRDSLRRSYLKTFNDIYSVRIDTTDYDTNFILAKSKNGKLGFETYVSTKALEDGKHILGVNRLRIRRNDTINTRISRIPFWYYKD
ncbi:hypothetical protein D7030_12435 [Flavobacteriaceae bacterium AU392]|nr:hypothetical protein D1817_06055 [Flavobacteriaceae bacterium]RKM81123.1 hypothetical protein D7030_12435 [Flavobacteriaceae bacterium AU392]